MGIFERVWIIFRTPGTFLKAARSISIQMQDGRGKKYQIKYTYAQAPPHNGYQMKGLD